MPTALAAGLVMAACGGAATAPAGSSSAISAASPAASAAPTDLQSLVQAANKEGKVTVFGTYPQTQTVDKVAAAMNQRFNTNIQIEAVPMGAPDARNRILGAVDTRTGDGDTVPWFSSEMFPEAVQKNAIAKVDWPGIFSKEMPGVTDAYNREFADYRGYALVFYDSSYAFMYNTQQMKLEDVPKHWSDLADPKWRGKFAADPSGFPFNYLVLSPDWGEDKTLALVKGIAANKPLLKTSSSELTASVVRGEVEFAIAGATSAITEKMKGSPVDVAIPDYLPNDSRGMIISTFAPHPNATRLYTAWAVSDGFPLMQQLYGVDRLGTPTSPMSAIIKQQNPDTKVVGVQSAADVKRSADFIKVVADTMIGVN
ncbi:MAG: extracellular solute-binding protein [Chloroflexi bacterium]|nr:extracellular solute-binding protein [Chloroflexota bacterium]